jgi:hypothetical protein
MGVKTNVYNTLIKNPERKTELRRFGRCYDSIKTAHEEQE